MVTSISGVTKIKVIRLVEHPNEGVWLELSGAEVGSPIWVTVWLPASQFIEQMNEAMFRLGTSIMNNTKMEYTIEAKDVTIAEAQTTGV